MRILHLLNDIRDLGNGIVNVAMDLACLQAKAGYEVSVASAGGSYEALLAEYGVQHWQLDVPRRSPHFLQSVARYRQIIHAVKPGVVHAHMMTGAVLGWALRGRSRYRLVTTVHNEFQRSALLMGLGDRVIAVSQAVQASMVQRGISPHKLRVVCNGPIGSPRQSSAAIAASLQPPAIVTIAGMTHRKGIIELIDAFVQVATIIPTAHLYVVGDGPDRGQFEQYATATPVRDRIHFEGFQPQPQRYLQSSDVFVLASRQEPFGLVLAEAREAGCAIVATDVGGIPEVLEHGAAGILVPPREARAIAIALTNLLQHPDVLQAWQTKAKHNLDWLGANRMHQETLAVYAELLATKN
jgi:glycosyltransferase involved in cell wall biosynthesis